MFASYDGLRTSKTVDGVTTNYYYDGSLLIAEQSDTETIIYIYDANGSPVGFEYRNSTYAARTFDTYWYEKNMFGDIVAVYNAAGTKLISYTYDAWGNFTTLYHNGGAITTATNNTYTYRGYYYDSDLELYYLQSRYYDPNTCRFINADGYVSTGQGILGYNMFAYCGNNPVMGYDPTGTWDWGGVIAGVLLVLAGIITVATAGTAAPIAATIVAAATTTTGAVMTYAAATDSQMVVDVSGSAQVKFNTYAKGGGALVIDFDKDEVNLYPHVGGGFGISSGPSYSTGLVQNYETSDDYAGKFVDVFAGSVIGLDHGWSPKDGLINSTQATTITFSSGLGGGTGYDYYFDPIQVLKWGD